MAEGSGTAIDPWVLTTAPGSSTYTMYRDPDSDSGAGLPGGIHDPAIPPERDRRPAPMAVEQAGWVGLGAADEKKDPAPGTVEAWGRSPENPVGGWYGLRKGYTRRFGMYLPPLLEAQGLAELTTNLATTRSAPSDPLNRAAGMGGGRERRQLPRSEALSPCRFRGFWTKERGCWRRPHG